MAELSLEYRFDPSNLAPESEEASPSIMWWCSASPGWSKIVPVEWENGRNSLSKKQTISIPFMQELRTDDVIGMECIVMSQNHEQRWARSKAGSSLIPVKGLISNIFKDIETVQVDLRLNTFRPDDEPFLKGKMFLRSPDSSVVKGTQWKFAKPKYGLTSENANGIGRVLEYNALRSMAPFFRMEKMQELQFKPTDDGISSAHAPLWENEVMPLPGVCFWINYTTMKPSEQFFSRLARIALARRGLTEGSFIGSVEAQFQEKSDKLHPAFFDATIAIADMGTIVSTSLPYIGDYTYTSKRKSLNLMKDRVSIESFHDALRMLAGDCEVIPLFMSESI